MTENRHSTHKHSPSSYILEAAGYVAIAGVAAAEILTTPAKHGLVAVILLLGAFTLFYSLIVWLVHRDRTVGFILLCVAAAGAVTALMIVGAVPQFGAILFFILCSIVAMRLPSGVAVVATAGAAVILLLVLLFRERQEWLTDSLTFGVGYFGIVAFATAIRRTLQARRASQLLVEELRSAQEHVRGMALMEERQRLAREMHDAVGHRLTAASVLLEGAARLIPTDPDRASRTVLTAREQVREGLAELRSAVSALRDEGPTTRPLGEILRALVDVHAQGTRAEVSLTVAPDLGEPEPERKLVIVRTLQEALTNVQKHAAATKVSVELRRSSGGYALTCTDNGRGPGGARMDGVNGDALSAPNGTGFGLENLRVRAAALGGTVTLSTADGGGAVLRLELPDGEHA